jgi:hypothetical protein
MTIEPIIAIPRPIPILAVQFKGGFESFNEVSTWIQSQIFGSDDKEIPWHSSGSSVWFGGFDNSKGRFILSTLEGDMEVSPGDFVIRGIKGEFYPCKPDVFDAKYEQQYDFKKANVP